MTSLQWVTTTTWDESLWQKIQPIYEEAFPHGAKLKRILHTMLEQNHTFIHALMDQDQVIAMAITGLVGSSAEYILIIDYMAVHHDWRDQGIGMSFLEQIKQWAIQEYSLAAIVIEVEAEDTPLNQSRLLFWEKCGFIATSYVHQYIWVPEPYRAMVLPVQADFVVDDQGESLFRHIISFHEKAYRKR